MNKFYIEESYYDESNKRAYIQNEDEIRHITKSLRLTFGDDVELGISEVGDFLATIESIDKKQLCLMVKAPLVSRELPIKVDLFQGIPKGNKWDYLIQKSVEGGVGDIFPIQMVRSVAQFKEKSADKKLMRWQKIAEEAAKQSKRSYLTQIKMPSTLSEALKLMPNYDLIFTCYEDEKFKRLKDYEAQIITAQRIAFWIGPEGGIAESEITKLKKVTKCISLGRRILRTESAAIFALSQIGYIVD